MSSTHVFGMINAPAKSKKAGIRKCFDIMARHSQAFGMNESLYVWMRVEYRKAMRAHGLKAVGLWAGPNPIFYNPKRYRLVAKKVVPLHKGRTGAQARRYPGFNSKRSMTVGFFRDLSDVDGVAIINAHLAAFSNGKAPNDWVSMMHKVSLSTITAAIIGSVEAGYETWLIGDMNIHAPIDFRSLRKQGIRVQGIKVNGVDKMYRFTAADLPAEHYDWEEIPAPTDHGGGIVARAEGRDVLMDVIHTYWPV